MRELETMRASARVCAQIDATHPVSLPPNDTNDDRAKLSACYPRIPPMPSPKVTHRYAYYNTQKLLLCNYKFVQNRGLSG